MAEKTILVTVGTTQFHRLIKKVTAIETQKLLLQKGYNRLILQIGKGSLKNYEQVNGMNVIKFDFKDTLAPDIQKSDFVISHAGAGSCLEVLEAGKPLLVVINEKLMNNHQAELANALEKRGYVFACTPDNLYDTLENSDPTKLKAYPKGDVSLLVNFLDDIMGMNPTEEK